MLECCICGDPIISPNHAHYETVGWTHPRKAGGANHIELPVRTGSAMCEACMVKKKLEAKRGPLGATLF